jgi:cytochrome c-type biogenesis protein CcmE
VSGAPGGSTTGSAFLGSRRAQLIAVLLGVAFLVTVLAVQAADDTLSYYVTPEEFAQEVNPGSNRWRVGGRVVEGTVVEDGGRPSRFEIVGEHGERMTISYPAGAVPSLFGPGAFVVVEGSSEGAQQLRASSVIIKHENEFLTGTPTVPAMR